MLISLILTLLFCSPITQAEEVPLQPYVDQLKDKLSSQPHEEGGAIAAVQEDRSELHARRLGEIHHAAGFRVGATLNRNITAAQGVSSRSFQDVYGDKWAPDMTLFYEFQPFHSEWLGNIGMLFSVGVAYYKGAGTFAFAPINPAGGNFSSISNTRFQFFSVPLMAGFNYRFNLLRILRPFVEVGPTLIGYYETRTDDKGSNRGNSKAMFTGAGVSLLLDWIDRRSTWDLYTENDVKHYYLTFEYSKLTTFSGDVRFNVSGLNLGFTYEF